MAGRCGAEDLANAAEAAWQRLVEAAVRGDAREAVELRRHLLVVCTVGCDLEAAGQGWTASRGHELGAAEGGAMPAHARWSWMPPRG